MIQKTAITTVEAFRNWQLQQGYAIDSINGRLSTVRTFAKIAAKTGAISPQESILIASAQGYASKEARHIDEQRRVDGTQTRKGAKKAEAVTIPEDTAQALINQPDTPKGRRCRHYAATFEARKGTPVDRLVDMFGWNSPAMAFRYIEAAHIANEGTARVKQA